MNISEILNDSLRYPLLEWKKILVLGIIILISGLSRILGISNIDLIVILVGLGFLSGFLVNGYLYRIVKSTLDSNEKLPEFNNWIEMFRDGFKVFIIFIVYLILPTLAILFIILFITGFDFTFFESDFLSMLGSMGINPLEFLVSEILPGIEILIAFSFNLFTQMVIVTLISIILLLPIFLVALANMAYEGEFIDAFRIREIIEEIRYIKWINLIKWYIMTGIIFLVLFCIGTALTYVFGVLNLPIVGLFLLLLLVSYSYIYYARSLGLFYLPD